MTFRRIILYICLLHVMTCMAQQTVTLHFHDVSLPEALLQIHQTAPQYPISFIYDELEDFTVTADIRQMSVADAVRKVTEHYPIRLTFEGNKIYVECIQKEPFRLRGRVTNRQGVPIQNVNITVIGGDGHSTINHGVSNANGQFVVPCPTQRVTARLTHVGYDEIVNLFDLTRHHQVMMSEKTTLLTNVTVEQHQKRSELLDYSQFYYQISDEVWNSYMPEFNRSDTPELWADSAVIILAELDSVRTIKGLESFWVSNRGEMNSQYELHRRRYKINQESGCSLLAKMPYDKAMVSSFESVEKSLYWSSKKKTRERIKNISVIGIRVIKTDGTIHTINTIQYLRPSTDEDPIRLRPDSIDIPGLQTGDIIDVFTYHEQRSYDHDEALHHLFRFQQSYPVVNYRMACSIDGRLYARYNYWDVNDVNIKGIKTRKGNYYLSRHLYFQDSTKDHNVAGAVIYTQMSSLKYAGIASKTGLITPEKEDMVRMEKTYIDSFDDRLHGIVLKDQNEDVRHALFISTSFTDSIALLTATTQEKADILVSEAQRIIHQVPDSYKERFIHLLIMPLKRVGAEYDLWLTTPESREPIDYLTDIYSLEPVIHLKYGATLYNDADHPYEIPHRLKGRKAVTADKPDRYFILGDEVER